MEERTGGIRMYDSKAAVSVLVAIMTTLVLLTGCATDPLSRSARRGNVSKVEKHIDEGADVNARNWWSHETVLTLAVRGGNLQIVTLLIEAGATVDSLYGGPLKAAAEAGNVEMARLLIEAGADIDAMYRQYTPLMIAAEVGDVEMAKLLIKSCANVNMWNFWDNPELLKPNTALMAASWNGHSEVAQLLIEAGADVHYRGYYGDTALEWAIFWGQGEDYRKMLETVVVLVQGGADGTRALMLVRNDWDLMDELAKLLHEAGAPKPHQLAHSGDYSEIAEYLKDWKSTKSVPAE
jgi:ankyrin repeat protein